MQNPDETDDAARLRVGKACMDLGAERLENEIAIYRMCTIPVEDRAHPLFEDFIDGDFADDQSPLITPSMTEFIRKARGLSVDEANSERVLGPERYRNANAYQFDHRPWSYSLESSSSHGSTFSPPL